MTPKNQSEKCHDPLKCSPARYVALYYKWTLPKWCEQFSPIFHIKLYFIYKFSKLPIVDLLFLKKNLDLIPTY